MSEQFETLFSPFEIGNMTVKNRIVSTAHVTVLSDEGMPAERLRRYYEEKAKGGAGLFICFGSASVHPTSPALDWKAVELFDDRVIPHLQEFSDMVHSYGAKCISQMTHRGRRGRSDLSWERLRGPSALKEPNHRENPGEISREELEEIVRAFADAAVRVQKGGFDGVEISAAHCHLIDQFWSPQNNVRTDEFGGDLEGRLKFAFKVIEAVRDAVGEEFVVGIRITGDDFREGGLDNETMCQIAEKLSEHGMLDFFNVIGGTGETHPGEAAAVPSMSFPLACFSTLAGHIREVVEEPVIAVGRINDPTVGERVLQQGHGDLVAMTRALIADPYLPAKAQHGKHDEIRQCMGYNEGCIDRQYAGKPLGCVQNPVIGFEREWADLRPASQPKRAVVVGGGPAGMEAARVMLQRGHHVVLFEGKEATGGQLNLAKRAPKRQDFDGVGRWLELQLHKLGADIRLGTAATAEAVLAEDPHAVVIATGAKPFRPPIPGLAECNYAVSGWDVIAGNTPPGRHVLVVDEQGGMESIGAAEMLLDEGREVELWTMRGSIGEELGATTKPPALARLYAKGAHVVTDWELKQVDNGTLEFRNCWADVQADRDDADVLVYSYGGVAVDDLAKELKDRVPQLYNVGDSYAPRSLHHAMMDAHKYAREV